MKKVGKYLSITLLLLTGLFFVFLLFLFFVPNASMFGITFISYNERTLSENYKIENVEKIVLNSRSYDIKIESTQSSIVSARIENHSLGYVLTKNSTLNLEEELLNGVLTFTVNEPYGVAFKNNSLITLLIPESKEVDLKIENKNANVTFEDKNLKIKNLTYKAEKGIVNVKDSEISGVFNLDLKKSTFYITKESKLNSNDINLKLTTGRFEAVHSHLGDINILSNERGVILLNNVSSINQKEQTTGGRIEANQVATVSITGSDTNLYINEITTRASISLRNAGEVKINLLSGIADIVTNSGDIKIKSCTKNLTTLSVLTDDGDISVYNAYNKVFAETSSGNITTTFASDADKISIDNKNTRYFKAITKTGKIVAKGINRTDIEIKSDGSADLSFENFDNNLNVTNNITSKNGNIYVKVNSLSSFILNSSTQKGHSRINLLQTESYKGWTDKSIQNKAINCDTSTNVITIAVSGSGNILMHDDKVN